MFIPLHIKQIMAHSIIGPFVYDGSDLQFAYILDKSIMKKPFSNEYTNEYGMR